MRQALLLGVGGLALSCTVLGQRYLHILASSGSSVWERTAGKWGAEVFWGLNHNLWDPRELFCSMSGFEPCRSTYQLHSYSKILIQVVQATKTSTTNPKLQFSWDEWLLEGTNYVLIQSVAYEERIQLLINLLLGWLCQIFFKGFWSLEHYFFTFPATLKFFRGVQYSRVMKLFSEGITW